MWHTSDVSAAPCAWVRASARIGLALIVHIVAMTFVPPPPPAKKNNTKRILIIVAVVLVLYCGGGITGAVVLFRSAQEATGPGPRGTSRRRPVRRSCASGRSTWPASRTT